MRKFNDPSLQYFFASDAHIGHNNIIKYDKQNYRDSYERDEDIVAKWNEVVRPKDYVFHLGDFAFIHNVSVDYVDGILSRLNGHKIFIKGNHDCRDMVMLFKKHGEFFGKLEEIIVMKQMVTLCHYRMDLWRESHRGSWHFHGHTHCCFPDNKNKMIIDVGLMGNDMKPLSFSQISTIMSKKTYVPEYHHSVFTDPSRQ